MKILHLRASNFYGGPERQLHYHARLARQSEYEITVGSFLENGREPEFLRIIGSDGIRTVCFDVSNAYDISATAKLRNFLKSNGFNILATHDYRTHFWGFLATRGTGVRWLAFSRGWTLDNIRVRLFHWIDKIIIRFADHIVAVSRAQKIKLERLLVPSSKISVAPNALEISAFEKLRPDNLKIRFGFPDTAIVIISGGRFSREKGQEFLIRVAELAIKADDSLRFVIFGDGPDLEKIRARISSSGLNDKIICPGFEKEIGSAIRGADLLVNPSMSEGMPNIVLEAMALGTPVIATAVGGVPEIIENRNNGILIKYGDSDDLLKAILTLAGNSALRQKIAESAISTINNSFSFHSQMIVLSEVYSRLIEPEKI
jgi:glycosyltransferase involved in cell wall biosynthesis